MERRKVLVFAGSLIFASFFFLVGMDEEPEWIFLRDMPQGISNDKHDVWRIKDQKLELNVTSGDPVTLIQFTELLDKADEFPVLLVALCDTSQFYTMIAPPIGNFFQDEGTTQITSFAKTWEDLYHKTIYKAEVYFAGADKKFDLLTTDAKQLFFQQKLCKYDRKNNKYELIEELTVQAEKGVPFAYVGNLFFEQAASLKALGQDKDEITKLEQIAKKWFGWALYKLDKFSQEYFEVKKKYDAIPEIKTPQVKPEPQPTPAPEPEPAPTPDPHTTFTSDALVKGLQNLSMKLRNLGGKLRW